MTRSMLGLLRSSRLAVPLLSAALLVLGCGGDDGGGEVLECSGTCSCNPDTNECTCNGGSDCEVTGGSGITFVCEGNAECSLSCGDDCTVECPGTSGCEAEMGDNSAGVCNGTGDCDYTCHGDCTVDCPGTSACTVRCPTDAECNITSCSGPMLRDCGDGAAACRTDCPPPLGADGGA